MIDLKSLKRGDWIEVKDIDGETLSILFFLRKESNDLLFHVFYIGSKDYKKYNFRWYLNDKWNMNEIKKQSKMEYKNVRKYFPIMFNTLFLDS